MRRGVKLAALLVAAIALPACGSQETKMERGVVVDREEAVPEDVGELEESEAAREKKIDKEDEEKSAEEFSEEQR